MIGILDYGAGNIKSVQNALDRLGQTYFVSDDPEQLGKADKIIFPGVGHAKMAMETLKSKNFDQFLRDCEIPVLGICLGMGNAAKPKKIIYNKKVEIILKK